MAAAASSHPLVAVIGGTGAQGEPVIKHLVQDGAYRVRTLTRDPQHRRAQRLLQLGPKGHVELVKGSAMQEDTIRSLFHGADAAFVNLDGFAMGERRETFWGARIFEIAQECGIKHYVWGSLDFNILKTNWQDPSVRCGHYDGKGRVAQYMKSFPSPTPWGVTWSILTSGPYLEMLNEFLSPLVLPDGTRSFSYPLGKGRIPFIALDDLGYYARYMFDHPQDFSGKDLEVATELVSGKQLAEAFTKVTGHKAEYIDIPEATYFTAFDNTTPAGYNDSHHQPQEDGPMTWSANFHGFWGMWRADALTRDFALLDSIHPGRQDLEGWIKSTGYDGAKGKSVLKNLEDFKTRPIRVLALIRAAVRGQWAYWRGDVEGYKASLDAGPAGVALIKTTARGWWMSSWFGRST